MFLKFLNKVIWTPGTKYPYKRAIAKLSLKNELYMTLIWLGFRYETILVNVKWQQRDSNNHLVRKRTLSHFAKLDIAPVSTKRLLDIQATMKCRFTLKRVRDMIITYSLINMFSLFAIFLQRSFRWLKKSVYFLL